jgi:hypothetical protein
MRATDATFKLGIAFETGSPGNRHPSIWRCRQVFVDGDFTTCGDGQSQGLRRRGGRLLFEHQAALAGNSQFRVFRINMLSPGRGAVCPVLRQIRAKGVKRVEGRMACRTRQRKRYVTALVMENGDR